jgi:hypothetical protein
MSSYRLIKESRIEKRKDTITDLLRINNWLYNKGQPPILSYGQSLRALENSISLGLEKVKDKTGLPNLQRGESYYNSIIVNINEKERHKFNWINDKNYRESNIDATINNI